MTVPLSQSSGTSQRYVIMANGKGARWADFLGIPKHLISVSGETLLQRIVRQIKQRDSSAEVIISASDPRCETEGAIRYTPLHNQIELDRFVPELLCDGVCFLYGDTYYTDEAMNTIFKEDRGDMTFFGTSKSLVAIRAQQVKVFEYHLAKVRDAYSAGEITTCKGWQVCRSYMGLLLTDVTEYKDDSRRTISIPHTELFETSIQPHCFVLITDKTGDFNNSADLLKFNQSHFPVAPVTHQREPPPYPIAK